MSPELQEFYNSYQAWLDNGAPHDTMTYHRCYGLCYALHSFTMRKYKSLTASNIHRKRLCDEMNEQFLRELGHDDGFPELTLLYPFGSPKQYKDEEMNETAHLNPQRVAWVRKHATNAKEQAK